jgi:hypothetical protein
VNRIYKKIRAKLALLGKIEKRNAEKYLDCNNVATSLFSGVYKNI